MANKGTKEGTDAEVGFVKYANKNKNIQNCIWSLLSKELKLSNNLENIHVVRVISKVNSKLNNKKVLPKADAYLVKGMITKQYLQDNDYFLDESDINKFNLQKINYSGVSIKRPDSTRFQILKMTPDSFNSLIGNYILGAGASVYCTKISELSKNEAVLRGWHTNWENLIEYFNDIDNIQFVNSNQLTDEEKLTVFKKIKDVSNKKIKDIFLNNKSKLDIAFKGTEIFDEPYPAYFLFKDNKFMLNEPFDFRITTGSGRSRGDFTIVLKP